MNESSSAATPEPLKVGEVMAQLAERLLRRATLDVPVKAARQHVLNRLQVALETVVKPCITATLTALLADWATITGDKRSRGKKRRFTEQQLFRVEEVDVLVHAFSALRFDNTRILATLGDKIEAQLLAKFAPSHVRTLVIAELASWDESENKRTTQRRDATPPSRPLSASAPAAPAKLVTATASIGEVPSNPASVASAGPIIRSTQS